MSTESGTSRMIPAREIKRRGVSSLDALLIDGPVYIIKNDRPQYVLLSEEQYVELLEGYEEATRARVKESLDDLAEGRVKKTSADDLIKELRLEA